MRENGLGGLFSEPAFGELRQSPGIFRGQLFNNIAGFQLRRQDFPGVGFHFEVGTEGRLLREKIEQFNALVHEVRGQVLEQMPQRPKLVSDLQKLMHECLQRVQDLDHGMEPFGSVIVSAVANAVAPKCQSIARPLPSRSARSLR